MDRPAGDAGDRPIVSVVTPVLNPGPRLQACLDSVAAQTYQGHVEHIVVDGGSTDGTLDLLRGSSVAWISEPDGGQSDAINKGFAMAAGEVLTWLNADDALAVEAIERAVSALQRARQAGWVYGDLRIEQDGRGRTHRPPHPPALEHFQDGCPIPGVGTFITRWALEEIGNLDDRLHLAMDLDLWVRLLDRRIASTYVPAVQATFVLHRGSKTGQPDLTARYREQVLVFAKAGHLELAGRAVRRWEWWALRRDVQRMVSHGDIEGARLIARGAMRWGLMRPRKLLGLILLAVAPRLGIAVLERLGHGVQT